MNRALSKTIVFTLILFLFSLQAFCNNAQKAELLLKQLIARNSEVTTLEYNALMRERIKGKFVDKNSFFKINVKPRKIFVKQSFIGITLEGLYAEGVNKNQLLIATVSFPWIQLSLDPLGSRVRNNHHHTIFESGFGYFVNITEKVLNKYSDSLSNMLAYDGEIIYNKRKCHKITLSIPSYHYYRYTVGANENLTTIANKLSISDYMLVDINPDVSDYKDVKPGQVIKVPSDYGKKFVLYLDVELNLPLLIEIYDEKGMYASYAYQNLVINPKYASNEFSPTFSGYHFR